MNDVNEPKNIRNTIAFVRSVERERGHHLDEDRACVACCTDSSVGCVLGNEWVRKVAGLRPLPAKGARK